MGLSICKEIILAQGGSVDIKSEMGVGTEFIINLKAKCMVDFDQMRNAQHRIETLGYDSSPRGSSHQSQAKSRTGSS